MIFALGTTGTTPKTASPSYRGLRVTFPAHYTGAVEVSFWVQGSVLFDLKAFYAYHFGNIQQIYDMQTAMGPTAYSSNALSSYKATNPGLAGKNLSSFNCVIHLFITQATGGSDNYIDFMHTAETTAAASTIRSAFLTIAEYNESYCDNRQAIPWIDYYTGLAI